MFIYLHHYKCKIMNAISLRGHIQLNVKNVHFRKKTLCTLVVKNSHNSACGQYFFMKLVPLCSADTELLNRTKNSIFMRNPKYSLFS